MYNGEIISYTISERPHLKQVMDMLNKALDKIADGTNLIFHSDTTTIIIESRAS